MAQEKQITKWAGIPMECDPDTNRTAFIKKPQAAAPAEPEKEAKPAPKAAPAAKLKETEK